MTIRANDLAEPVLQHRFCKRMWRLDFAWPDKKLALEIEGGIWIQGAHTRGKHFLSDCEKYNTATLLGWRVLRCAREHVNNGQMVGWVVAGLEA